MSVTLVTGGTGMIGSHVVRALVARGDTVRTTVRGRSRTDNLIGVDAQQVECDILDRRQVRRAMRGVDRVFHCAGLTSLRASADLQFQVNVHGTRIVMEEALKAGAERVVHTSSFAAIGPAERGSTADEDQMFRAGRFGLAYVNAKHEAEMIVLQLAAAGLPVVIVNPAHVMGRGDLYRSSTEIVRRFLRCEIPAYVDGAICLVDVEDVAAGILLAEEKGNVGERYILGNRNYTLDRLFAELGRISGIEPPAVKLPLPAAMALVRGLGALPGRPAITPAELQASALWWTFRSNKARRDLGFKPGHHEDSLERTIAWYREREPLRLRSPGARQPLPLRTSGFTLQQVERFVSMFAG
ncbi:NAD-dependent epimerase/dehydratase family protein [Paraconexibacter antarcticus]|uniref:NAD-dependent epimerase/dehydratase family protein n=1 Tax=Paraconexibacter antarcticus TaxID=2949664 RepID=A0ABY5DUN8_9ACTN|nr:NAD-dependent epimerase/dehydratase family protein [Paraconexibacter antarcticus]UTI65720.1 NAD-dependent epimerase/dehydratase family protein [Paraconexibacter antarcticus]